MRIGRNEPCPCKSGKKYKKCCLNTKSTAEMSMRPTPRFRFEHGSYGMPGRVYLPSVICYEQVATDEWRDHFCLVNPAQCFDSADEASSLAEKDLNHATVMKSASGSDADFALSLKNKGYVTVDGFHRGSSRRLIERDTQ